jgi:hypothetical protein
VADEFLPPKEVPYRTVRIPACIEHEGLFAMTVRIPWICPVCGGPRGEPFKTSSFDGFHRLEGVDCWNNPCLHKETYKDVRDEYHHLMMAQNGPHVTPLDTVEEPRLWEARE